VTRRTSTRATSVSRSTCSTSGSSRASASNALSDAGNGPRSDARLRGLHVLMAAAACAAVCAALYGRVLSGPFAYDDLSLLDNSRVHAVRLSQVGAVLLERALPRRLGLATFALNFYLAGSDP